MTEDEKKEQIQKVALEVINLARSTLLINMRFLDSALYRLELTPCDLPGTATEGKRYFYNPRDILLSYREDNKSVNRMYMHSVMHCIFRHMFVNPVINSRLWDIACDIAVENAINDFDIQAIQSEKRNEQIAYTESLNGKIKFITAEKIYAYLQSLNLSAKKLDELHEKFYRDDHAVWYLPSDKKNSYGGSGADNSNAPNKGDGDEDGQDQQDRDQSESEQMWKEISEHIQTDLETFSKSHGSRAGGMMQELRAVNREKYDYTEFLRRFATLNEVMTINDDEFDYVFYTYGLSLYDDMPLVEPLEYKEVKRIKEFVIAIDTSGSTAFDLVHRFMNKTYNILKQEESFFTKINLHIVQCDARIQEDAKITCQEEFDKYISGMKLRGMGGTDFRPVFHYVDKLIRDKEFENLKGLIYFTDGCGTYPTKKPEYDTAFVFIDDDYNDYRVPVWAMKLILQKDDI